MNYQIENTELISYFNSVVDRTGVQSFDKDACKDAFKDACVYKDDLTY